MQEKEFNLLEESWIKVLTNNLSGKEVSLKGVFANAHKYKCLAGEMPTMDVAILRVLLSIVITIFYRYDVEGNLDELSEENDTEPCDVLERWEDYWEKGQFNEDVFNRYLEEYEERFWLFHPETPFFQVPDLQYGTTYDVNCLLGNLKESNNKATKHHFSMQECNGLSKAEAVRWLLHLNGYAVNIKYDKQAPGTTEAVGTGRLSRLGVLVAKGDNLFQTLMLNLNALKDGTRVWMPPKPIWEKEVRKEQGQKIPSPNNLAEAYTIQSRRITLNREDNMIIGFRAIGGDYCTLENAFYEQMTLWNKQKDSKTKQISYLPKTFQPERQIWREFSTMFNTKEMDRLPGIVNWIHTIKNRGMLEKKMITFQTVGLKYGDAMSYTYGNCISDSITLSSDILVNLDGVWIERITDEIENCRKVETFFSEFSADIVKLYYGKYEDKKKQIKQHLSEQFYARIDIPFREWLSQINPEDMEKEKTILKWERTAYHLARQVVEEYVKTLNEKIYEVKEDGKYTLSVPGILNKFLWKLSELYKNIA